VLILGCAGPAPVVGYPWVEDGSLGLASEVLTLSVLADRVSVDVLFMFEHRADRRDRVMCFPVAGPGGPASSFRAVLPGAGVEAEPLESSGGPACSLPAGEPVETFRILVPGEALWLHGGRLRVAYEQEAACGFSYVLSSGAYWKGPIGSLDVIVADEGHRVESALVEGEPAHAAAGTTRSWSFAQLEPRGGVELGLACTEGSP
jgi:hypothetical protein